MARPRRAPFHICIHPDDQRALAERPPPRRQARPRVRIEYRYIKRGKEQIWIRSVARPETDEHGNVVRLAGIAQDITAMRTMAQQLAASEAKFRDLTQLSSDWVWETDAEHRVSFLSDSVVAALGAWAKGNIGRHFWDGNLIGLPRANWEGFKADLESDRQFENFQYSLLDPDGNLYSIAISGRGRASTPPAPSSATAASAATSPARRSSSCCCSWKARWPR